MAVWKCFALRCSPNVIIFAAKIIIVRDFSRGNQRLLISNSLEGEQTRFCLPERQRGFFSLFVFSPSLSIDFERT